MSAQAIDVTSWPARARRAAVLAFGVAALVLLLGWLVPVPGVAVLVLGYLLVVEGRVARGTRLADAFPLVGAAPRFAFAIVAGWLWLLPVRLLWHAAQDARVIAPGAAAGQALLWLTAAAGALVGLHLLVALLRGAPVSAVVWPPGNARWAWARLRQPGRGAWAAELAGLVRQLEPLRYLLLGLKGSAGALLWLLLPTALWFAARAGAQPRPGLAVFGGLLLIPVLGWLPFLQVHFAVEGRFRALFEVKRVRERFGRAPLAFFAALVLGYVLTLPLFVFKIVLPPRDAAWLATPFFVGAVLVVRLVLAAAWRRAGAKPHPSVLAWPTRLLLVPVLAIYAGLLFLTPLVDSHGSGALLSHHAFLLPSPF